MTGRGQATRPLIWLPGPHYNNVSIQREPGTAPDCRLALRGLQAAQRHGRAMEYSLAVFAACHGACEDISDAGVLVRIASKAGVDE